jgi:hypothetical protein
MVLGSTQPLTEMSTRNLPGGKARKVDNLSAICDCLENVGASNVFQSYGIPRPCYRDSFIFFKKITEDFNYTRRVQHV